MSKNFLVFNASLKSNGHFVLKNCQNYQIGFQTYFLLIISNTVIFT